MSIIQMLIAQMFSGEDVGDIGHSLRFRSSASAYLSRTPAGAGNRKTWTWSGWVKRGTLTSSGAGEYLLNTASSSDTLRFDSDYTLQFIGSSGALIKTSAFFRDPTAYLHVVLICDTTNATANDRTQLWVNGVRQALSSNTQPALNADSGVNTTNIHNLARATSGTGYFDGYMSRVCFVDGQALTPDSFGYLNTNSNEWVSNAQSAVKAVVDAGGTNSFMLDFDNGTSTTTLGYDKSSKGNNWTLNNISLTAGVTYDWMLDVPGNSYATLNPLIPSAANLTNGNLSSGTTAARGTFNCTALDSQWFVTAGASAVTAGVIDDSGATNTTSVTANKVFAFKMTTAGALSYKNVTDAGSWTSIATGLTGNRWPYSVTQAASWNFGQQPLPEALDTGFLALCQANLPDPEISNPEMNFDVVLDTGANIKATTEAVFPSNFFEWIKDRANANNHQLLDTVRGSSAVLQSNTNAAETTYAAPSGSSVGWVWKAGGTPAANTDGSITSSVSANQEAGFSITSYTGTGANATVGHGLGVAPKMVIVKQRDNVRDWGVYHANLTSAAYGLLLNSTGAQSSIPTLWNSTAPSASVFSVGTSAYANGSTGQYVAYCFSEIEGYSKIGSYTGNGSTDGPFVHCGFKPKFVLVKNATTTVQWILWDSARDTYNVANKDLLPSNSSAEPGTGSPIDFLSNGFKVRGSGGINTSGNSIIFIAFADVPSKYSLAR